MAAGGRSMIRAAAKVIGIGLSNSRLLSGVVPETAVAIPIRRYSVKCYPDNIKTATAIDTQTPPESEKPCFGETTDHHHRLNPVIAAPPTVEGSKMANADLNDSIEMSNGCLQDFSHGLHRSLLDERENKDCVAGIHSTPDYVTRAYRFLESNPQLQEFAIGPEHWEALERNIRSQIASVEVSPGKFDEEKPLETMKICGGVWKRDVNDDDDDDMGTSFSDLSNPLFGVQKGDKEEEGESSDTSSIPPDIEEVSSPTNSKVPNTPATSAMLLIILSAFLMRRRQ